MVVPFTIFLITLFYACKKNKVVEGFESNDLYNLILRNLNGSINYDDSNKNYFDKNNKSFIEFNKLLEDKQGDSNYRRVKISMIYILNFLIFIFSIQMKKMIGN